MFGWPSLAAAASHDETRVSMSNASSAAAAGAAPELSPGRRGAPAPRSSYRPGIASGDLNEVLPGYVTTMLRDGLRAFDRQLRGFITGEATLIGVESRTSAPVRIVRDDDCRASGIAGLYPAGEGAGYAGGITSAALDGMRVADAIVRQIAG